MEATSELAAVSRSAAGGRGRPRSPGVAIAAGRSLETALAQQLRRSEQLMDQLLVAADPRPLAPPPPVAALALGHLHSGGRRVRARLSLTAGHALGLDPGCACSQAAACELLHNAALVHDDLQDRDRQRRGQPTLWWAHGEDRALCSGDLLLSAAYAALARGGQPARLAALLGAAHRAVAEAIEGQCADLHTAQPSLAQYQQIVHAKSGALLALPLQLALLAAGAEGACGSAREACDAFAIAYQIVDDLDDQASDEASARPRPALNLLSLLAAEGEPASALTRARTLAQQALQRSATRSRSLPADCGWLLRELGEGLARRLESAA